MPPEDDHALMISVDVIDRNEVGTDIMELTLQPRHREFFPVFQAGAHTTIELPSGMRRAYSLISDPQDRKYWRIAIRYEASGRGGSKWLHEHAIPGLNLSVSDPKQFFGLDSTAQHHVFIAGGIGITPFLPMALELCRTDAGCALHYAVRDHEGAAYLRWLRNMLGSALHVYDSSTRLNLEQLLQSAPANTHAYCCGPKRMLEGFAAATHHWPKGTTHVEWFSGNLTNHPVEDDEFRVQIDSSGEVLTVPLGYSLLNVLLDAGCAVEVGCESGVCGECVVGVLGGEVHHRDLCLSPDRQLREMTTCVSRGRGLLRLAI